MIGTDKATKPVLRGRGPLLGIATSAVVGGAVAAVRVRALDRNGQPFEIEADGLLSVCVQHEMDHLEGKLFVDYLSELKRMRIRKKLEKERRERGSTAPARERSRVPVI